MAQILDNNIITKEEMAAINGPMARDDGSLVAVLPHQHAWKYTVQPADLSAQPTVSQDYQTSLQARQALMRHLNAAEKKIWQEPYKELNVGEPWRTLKVGNVQVSNEAVFVRACYTKNEFLANQVVGEFKRRYASDHVGNTIAHYAALASPQLLEKFNTLHKVNFRRININKQSPAHFAQGNKDKVEYIIKNNGSAFQKDKFGHSAVNRFSVDDQKHLMGVSMLVEQQQSASEPKRSTITHERDPNQTVKRQ